MPLAYAPTAHRPTLSGRLTQRPVRLTREHARCVGRSARHPPLPLLKSLARWLGQRQHGRPLRMATGRTASAMARLPPGRGACAAARSRSQIYGSRGSTRPYSSRHASTKKAATPK